MVLHEGRVRENQAVFREVNQRIAEISRLEQESMSDFLCECGNETCATTVTLDLSEYEAVRHDSGSFLVEPGHGVDGLNRVIERRGSYDVVKQV